MNEQIPPDVAAGLARMSEIAKDEYLGWLPENDPMRKILESAADWIKAHISPTALAAYQDGLQCRNLVEGQRCFLNAGHEGDHLAASSPPRTNEL